MKFYSVQSLKVIEVAGRGLANVLITGASGTGKTCLAREIHEKSVRSKGPFVVVNLATVHEGTLESELFGHEKGSFTGAEQRRLGKLESANGGTVFLDEIGELGPKFQARLLEFLQSRSIVPVGSNREIKLDVRVIAATNRDLKSAVKSGEFREDLFHRLRVLPIELKPVREREEELDGLVHYFISELCRIHDRVVRKIAKEVAERLEAYSWPGNFREVRNVLEYAVLCAESGEIHLEDLPEWFLEESQREMRIMDLGNEMQQNSPEKRPLSTLVAAETDDMRWPSNYDQAVAEFEKMYFRHALRKHRGRVNHTARQLGMNKTTLLRRIRTYGLESEANGQSVAV